MDYMGNLFMGLTADKKNIRLIEELTFSKSSINTESQLKNDPNLSKTKGFTRRLKGE